MKTPLASLYATFRALTLLTALLAVILTVGQREIHSISLGSVLGAICYGIVFLTAGYLIGARRMWLVVYLVLAIITILANWTSMSLPGERVSAVISFVSSLCMHSMLLQLVFKFALFDDDAHQVDRIIAGISGYLIIGLFWYNLYSLCETISPGGFTVGNGATVGIGDGSFMYFSLVTITSLGYGDVTPITQFTRLISSLEAVAGTLYLAIFISTLVSSFKKK